MKRASRRRKGLEESKEGFKAWHEAVDRLSTGVGRVCHGPRDSNEESR